MEKCYVKPMPHRLIQRKKFIELVEKQLSVHPACAILGPRQSGKTTLAKQFAAIQKNTPIHFFDLENPQDHQALTEPMRILERLSGLVIIDEIQRLPELFPILRVLIDKKQAQYLILGSASRDLIHQSSESLAGRIGYIELTPLQISEGCDQQKLLIRGGFPNSYLASSDEASYLWREAYIQTFLERDIPSFGFRVSPFTLRRSWMMLTHVHGQILNQNELATSLGISTHAVRHQIDILTGTFMMRTLLPWYENIHKRQTKTPKIFFRDSGILLSLLTIHSEEELLRHPRLGAIWEGFALEQIIQKLNLRNEEVFFWRTHQGAELDLLTFIQGKRIGFEFKYADAPTITKSMQIAIKDLNLDHLYVIYPGQREYFLKENIQCIGLQSFIL